MTRGVGHIKEDCMPDLEFGLNPIDNGNHSSLLSPKEFCAWDQ